METRPSEKQNQQVLQPVDTVFEVNGLNLWYGDHQALKDVSLAIPKNKVTSIIGPSGCGKSTFIKTLNRMVEVIPGVRTTGDILYHGQNILDSSVRVEALRTQVGMVFQKPNPFPKSILANVMYGPKRQGIHDKKKLMEIAEQSLVDAALWDEVKDRLGSLGTALSGGQQQRLTIARALSHQPEILCLDEFSIAIDPVTTMRIEDVLRELRREITIILVTNLTHQARRLTDRTMFLWNGRIIELDRSDVIFSDQPSRQETLEYVNGIFG